MTIRITVDRVLVERGMSAGEFADAIGITPANVAVLKNGRAKAVRLPTLDAPAESSSVSRATYSTTRTKRPGQLGRYGRRHDQRLRRLGFRRAIPKVPRHDE